MVISPLPPFHIPPALIPPTTKIHNKGVGGKVGLSYYIRGGLRGGRGWGVLRIGKQDILCKANPFFKAKFYKKLTLGIELSSVRAA